MRLRIYTLLFVIQFLWGCSNDQKRNKSSKHLPAIETVAGNFSDQNQFLIDSNAIPVFLTTHPLFNTYESEIRSFYRNRDHAYAWFENNTLIEQAGNLVNQLSNLTNEGIYARPPYLETLDSLLHFPNQQKDFQTLEIMLTAQYFAFMRMAWEGVDQTESQASKWFLPRKRIPYALYLDSILSRNTSETASIPVYRQYTLLKNYLKKYKELEDQNAWPILTNKGLSGAKIDSPNLNQVRKRLYLLGDLPTESSEELTVAIESFQQRHGIPPTGTIDMRTLKELNRPIKERIKQIVVNMERSRWLPVEQKADYIAVNIPEFKLHYYRSDSLLWSCNVVVGKTMNRTTIFYGEIDRVVFSPYWNIPTSIVRKEILPQINKEPNYLEAHDMEIKGTTNGVPMIRQRPGKNNPLGQVKFLFPNSYNIYLHDSPSQHLFGASTRTFSHGCIRVAEPTKLAEFLLKEYPEWPTSKIKEAMALGKETSVALKEKTPVFIAYFTAFVDRNNRLNFRDDIYQLDQRLATMLMLGKSKY